MLCAVLAHGRSEASKSVSGLVDVRASCLKVSMQCLLYITQDPETVKKRTDFVTFTCLYFATGRCLTELRTESTRGFRPSSDCPEGRFALR